MLHSHKLLSPFQSGFMAGYSTTAMLKVTEDIREAMENKNFSNAFNAVYNKKRLYSRRNLDNYN